MHGVAEVRYGNTSDFLPIEDELGIRPEHALLNLAVRHQGIDPRTQAQSGDALAEKLLGLPGDRALEFERSRLMVPRIREQLAGFVVEHRTVRGRKTR